MAGNRKRSSGIKGLLSQFNLGTAIFFIFFMYIVISIFAYVTSHKTEVYQVRMGTLSDNAFYRGIALRDEKLVSSRYTGTINYYNREGDRVKVGGLAYSVTESGDLEDYSQTVLPAGGSFTGDELSSFRNQAISFTTEFHPDRFYAVYDFKNSASSQAQEISGRALLRGIKDLSKTPVHAVSARDTGSIVYSYDSLLGKSFEEISAEDFDPSTCMQTRLENGKAVQEGQPAYRIVTDENWSVAIRVDSPETAERMVSEKEVQVRFTKNNYVSRAYVESRTDENGSCFVNLCFSNSMETFCMDRFVDIEILTNEERGLKVPNSSITVGDFFLVPKEYVFDGTNGQQGVLLRVYRDGGSSGTRFVPAVPYSETEDEYYLDNSVLREGMILERLNSSDQFTIGKKEELVGVYYINKGYPDFLQVSVILSDSEYSIVKSNEINGLQEYDYIVLHADAIRFNSR